MDEESHACAVQFLQVEPLLLNRTTLNRVVSRAAPEFRPYATPGHLVVAFARQFLHDFPSTSIIGLLFLHSLLHTAWRVRRRLPSELGRSEKLAKQDRTFDRARLFFVVWDVLGMNCFILGILNVKWATTPHWYLAVFVVCIQALLHWFVLETPLLAMLTMVWRPARLMRAPSIEGTTVVLNYNLLATCRDDVDECLEQMLGAALASAHLLPTLVLVSATSDPELRAYELKRRDACRERLRASGIAPADVAEGLARDFLVIHRVSRVLRKCGQYQDLMCLCAGYDTAFTYCSAALHGKGSRRLGEPLFHASPDVESLRGRRFDYTMVLDSDTRVEPGVLEELLRVGDAHPASDIIQPAIKLACDPDDSAFACLEAIRQAIFGPMGHVQTSFFGKSPFFGKGLLRSNSYLLKVIGVPGCPIDLVPVDVLSHDTFEAAVTSTLYVPDVHLVEEPCSNYASWSEREMRWNRGELILAMYFFPKTFGALMRGMQRLLIGEEQLRTKGAHVQASLEKLDEISVYFGHAALRTMSMKLVLLIYVATAGHVDMHYELTVFVVVLSVIIILPKLAVGRSNNRRACLVETVGSLLQFTPEAVIGSVRVLRAAWGLAQGKTTWVPQRAVEAEFQSSDPWLHALRYLWAYSLSGLITGVAVAYCSPKSIGMFFYIAAVVILPLFVGASSCKCSSQPWLLRALPHQGQTAAGEEGPGAAQEHRGSAPPEGQTAVGEEGPGAAQEHQGSATPEGQTAAGEGRPGAAQEHQESSPPEAWGSHTAPPDVRAGHPRCGLQVGSPRQRCPPQPGGDGHGHPYGLQEGSPRQRCAPQPGGDGFGHPYGLGGSPATVHGPPLQGGALHAGRHAGDARLGPAGARGGGEGQTAAGEEGPGAAQEHRGGTPPEALDSLLSISRGPLPCHGQTEGGEERPGAA